MHFSQPRETDAEVSLSEEEIIAWIEEAGPRPADQPASMEKSSDGLLSRDISEASRGQAIDNSDGTVTDALNPELAQVHSDQGVVFANDDRM